MKLLFPLGLLGLLAIPILILIYILRNRYKEHIVASSYLYELSNHFLKKKKKFNRFESLISLIIEILVVLMLSIALAHPVFYQKNQAENFCFILDASGSMNILNGEKSRFEIAQNKMNEIVQNAKSGSTYTLIYAGLETKTIVKMTESKDVFYEFNKNLLPEYAFIELDDAVKKAEEYYINGDISKLVLITDKNYKNIDNLELINVSSLVENYAIYDLEEKNNGTNLIFNGKLYSYTSDVTLTINLYLDEEFIESKEVMVSKEIENNFSFEVDIKDYHKAEVKIINDDALVLDNQTIFYHLTDDNASTILLVSDNPFYLESMINVLGNYFINIIEPDAYSSNFEGYDLYIFDCFTPDELPSKGAVWLLNSDQNIEHSGFLVQDERIATPETMISYNEEHNLLYEQIVKDVKFSPIMIYKYKKCSLYKEFTTIFNYDSIPLLFVGTSETNLREVVFSFDLHDTDLPLLYDFAPLMRNLLNYSLPRPIEDKNYVVGDDLQLNILSNFESLKIQSPSNKVNFVNLKNNIEYFTLTEVGTYRVTISTDNKVLDYYIYCAFDKEASNVTISRESISLINVEKVKKNNSLIDNLMIVILIGFVFFILEWMVYVHEQY